MIRSRRSAVALRHVAFEDLGLLAPIMEREGWNVSFCEAAVDDLSHRSIRNADLVIVLGGPIGVYETDDYPFLMSELGLLEYRLSRDLPTLGICLGSQLMAKALGGRVFKGPVKEIGWGTINLTDEGRSSCLKPLHGDDAVVLHWHGDTFDLPPGCSLLASTDICANQAFARGSNLLALQFHAEVTDAGFEPWLVGHACELGAAGLDPVALRNAAREASPVLRSAAPKLVSDWLQKLV